MVPKTKKKLSISAIIVVGSVCAALLTTWTFADKGNKYIDSRIEDVTKKYIRENIERDLKVLIEFNRQQAMCDSVKFVQWNKAIDIVDNAGKIK
jgi:hypothetical protein